jgi:hypothetical protein
VCDAAWRIHGGPRFVERLFGRLLARDDRADRELQALRNLGIDRNSRTGVAVDQHLAEPAVPGVLAEDREIAIHALPDRQMAGGFADSCGMSRRFDVADEFDGRLLSRRIAREHHPHPAAGSGRTHVRLGLRDRRDVPFGKLGWRQSGL